MSFFKSCIFSLFVILFTLCGCKVEPLYREVSAVSQNSTAMDSVSYGQHSGKNALGLSAKLAQIVIEEPSDHFSQMARNHLLFLLYGNGSTPSAPAYKLALQTSVFTQASVQVDIDKEKGGRSSVGTVIGRAFYTLQDIKNAPISKGLETVSVSFERLRQAYATLQAEEDAQRRAAEELAERIFISLSRDLLKH
ncbi:LPS assembly lipoprotein LptE [Bartonella sp. CB175]|uniref:LPS assembly lipoprotein LptE n=1 Tax=Bartonella sp. CB175 TaxID=3112256 RepID=UPI00300E06D9